MTNLYQLLFQLEQETIKDTSTEDLAKLYYVAIDERKESANCVMAAKRMDISDWKIENAQRTFEKSKERLKLVLGELNNRNVKSVARNGDFDLKA